MKRIRASHVLGGAAGIVRVKDRAVPAAFQMEVCSDNGTPDLVLSFEVRDGVPQCRRAELRSTEDGREVLSSDLRGVKLEDLLELAVLQVAMSLTVEHQEGGVVSHMTPITTEVEARETLTQIRSARREGRRRVTDDLLRDVARIYRENVDSNPTAAVADHTGRRHRTAALYVQQAREAGFLGASIPGKAGEQA